MDAANPHCYDYCPIFYQELGMVAVSLFEVILPHFCLLEASKQLFSLQVTLVHQLPCFLLYLSHQKAALAQKRCKHLRPGEVMKIISSEQEGKGSSILCTFWHYPSIVEKCKFLSFQHMMIKQHLKVTVRYFPAFKHQQRLQL